MIHSDSLVSCNGRINFNLSYNMKFDLFYDYSPVT